MENLWIKIALLSLIVFFVYREILKSAHSRAESNPISKTKAPFTSLLIVGLIVGGFTYAGMSVTRIETRDLRPYLPPASPQMVSIFDPGVIEVEGMVIKTNLAPKGELKSLSAELVEGCEKEQECEAQRLFDYVTQIPYHTDHTSRNALQVIETNWGDCDDKSNLYASLLRERGIEYLLIYVPGHVFMGVHLESPRHLPLIRASLSVEGKKYYYAETTASGARIGEFNGQFPSSIEGIYDLENRREIDLEETVFSMF
jgi:hypothetical protein